MYETFLLERIEFNARAKPEHFFHVDLLPEPYFGSPDGPVVALLLNPGYKAADAPVHADRVFQRLARDSMAHRLAPTPFLHLLEGFDNPGCRWWRRRTRVLRMHAPVGERLLALQYVGYKSKAFTAGKLWLPSMEYIFALLRRAMDRGAEVVVTRAHAAWIAAGPGLTHYPRLHRTKNPRSPYLTPGNLHPDSFGAIVRAMRAG
jgi:hypothetical protein